MELNNMKPTPNSRHSKKRVGRGDKTAGRGENGQKSRSGYSRKIGFEGGQNPLYKRIPKRGFTNFNSKFYTVVNISKINKLNLTDVSPEILIEKGVIKNNYNLLKILGDGKKLDKKTNIRAHKFSKSAEEAIKKSGGKAEIISTK